MLLVRVCHQAGELAPELCESLQKPLLLLMLWCRLETRHTSSGICVNPAGPGAIQSKIRQQQVPNKAAQVKRHGPDCCKFPVQQIQGVGGDQNVARMKVVVDESLGLVPVLMTQLLKGFNDDWVRPVENPWQPSGSWQGSNAVASQHNCTSIVHDKHYYSAQLSPQTVKQTVSTTTGCVST